MKGLKVMNDFIELRIFWLKNNFFLNNVNIYELEWYFGVEIKEGIVTLMISGYRERVKDCFDWMFNIYLE